MAGSQAAIKCSKEDDIFTPGEKKSSVSLEFSFDEHEYPWDMEIEREVQIEIDGKANALVISRLGMFSLVLCWVYPEKCIVHVVDNDEIEADLYDYRFLRHKNFITIVDAERKHYCSLSFGKESVAEKVMKIVWKYKTKKSNVNDVHNVPPDTITHSNHDFAAVFDYEEKNGEIYFSTSDENVHDKGCRIFLDVVKELIVITSANIDPVEVLFSQISSKKSKALIFKYADNQKLKLDFADNKIAEKVYGIIENVKEKRKALKAEEITLETMLKKLNDDPESVEEVKELVKNYAKTFTIFKEEEYQNRIYELYKKYKFHEKIVVRTESNTVERNGAEDRYGEVTAEGKKNNDKQSRKRKGNSDGNNGAAKRIKKELYEIVRYPDFEFHCDKNGIPKQKLVIFASKNKKNCYEFSYDAIGYKCSRCANVEAKYCVNEYGERFIQVNGKHACKPEIYKPEKIPSVKNPVFEVFTEPKKRNEYYAAKKLRIFTPSKTCSYLYELLKEENMDTHLWYCSKCKIQSKYVYACPTNDGETFDLLDEDHVCTPGGFRLPKMIIEEKSESDNDDEDFDV